MLLFVVDAGVWAFDGWLATCGFAGCPTPDEIRAFHPTEGGSIKDRNDKLIGRLAIVRRVNVELSAVPRHVQDAFIAVEDRRFRDHGGVDARAFVRAVVRNVLNLGVREGFSTITMQVAHNSFLQNRYSGRSFRRKLVELRISRLLERELTKAQILKHYLNVIYLGNGVYGVEAAARDLFGKSIDRVTLAEGAMLAALPKAPSTYTPRRNRDRARDRRNLVLALMAEEGYISDATAASTAKQPIRVAAEEWRPSVQAEHSAIDAVRALVDSVVPDALKEGDVTVYTTLDFALQRAADRVVVKQATAITRETSAAFGRVKEGAQGAFVALDPATGDVLAVVTGKRTNRREFNRAFDAKRQPGSAFKPFVYAAAMHAGFKPSTLVDDEPVEVNTGTTIWTPANYNQEYQGTVTFARALMKSSNAATVRISRAVGERSVIALARNNGIVSELPAVPSIALGSVEVTPLELVAAYAPFVNGGHRVTPRLVRRIEAPDGTLLWSSEQQVVQGVMDPLDAYEVTGMLRAVVDHGTGTGVRAAGFKGPVAGKTGTTNNATDVWFVGYTPTLVAAIWFGYDTPRPISHNAAGGRLAAPAWGEIVAAGWRERATEFAVPPGMVEALIDPETGQIAGPWCPRRRREWYRPRSVPTEECQLHVYPIAEEPQVSEPGSPERRKNEIDKMLDAIGRELGKIFRRKGGR